METINEIYIFSLLNVIVSPMSCLTLKAPKQVSMWPLSLRGCYVPADIYFIHGACSQSRTEIRCLQGNCNGHYTKQAFGGHEGNWTLANSLEGYCSTIKLHTHLVELKGIEPSTHDCKSRIFPLNYSPINYVSFIGVRHQLSPLRSVRFYDTYYRLLF